MRRALVALLVLLALPLMVSANERRQGYCQTQTVGLRVTGCTVTVFITGTTTLATIFQDNLNTPLANPFQADLTSGLWFFYAANGHYDINLSAGSPTISPAYTLSDFLFFDPAAFGASLVLSSISSQSSNVAQTGFVELAPGDCISWRNNANTLDNCLTENASDQLSYGGGVVGLLNAANTWTNTQTFQSVSGLTSSSPNPAQSGIVRLASGDMISWRNTANTGDLILEKAPSAIGNIPVDTFFFQNTLTTFAAGVNGLFFSVSAAGNNMAASGALRLESSDAVSWRNAANTADLALAKSGSDTLTWPNALQAAAFQSANPNPAHTGILRLANQDAVVSRDFGNTVDVPLIELDSFGFVDIGTAAFTPFIAASTVTFANSGTLTSQGPLGTGNGNSMSLTATPGVGTGAHIGGNVNLTAGSGNNGGASGVVQLKPVRAFSALPTCAAGVEGALVPVSDSTTTTWGNTITGGSTNHVLAYCDGSAWTVAAK